MLHVDRRLCAAIGWTPERVAYLKELCETTALSASQLAAQLGVTRNSIIGKCDRLGINIPGSLRIPLTPEQQRERHNKSKREKRAAMQSRQPKEGNTTTPRFQRAFAMNPDNMTRVGLLELTDDHCRWPYGEPGQIEYCGAHPEKDKPYCPFHCVLAYTPTAPRKLSLYFRFSGQAG